MSWLAKLKAWWDKLRGKKPTPKPAPIVAPPPVAEILGPEYPVADAPVIIRDAVHTDLTPEPEPPKPEPGTIPGQGQGNNGFLWKATSESNSKLVVLVPSMYQGSTRLVIATISDGSGEIEEGMYGGMYEDGRPAWRFSKPGSGYPARCYCMLYISGGYTRSWRIPNPGSRTQY